MEIVNLYKLYKKCKLENRRTNRKYSIGLKLILLFIGFLALIWFLIRVIPKPSRATYPCQQAAFPLASGFVVWLMGAVASVVAFRKAKQNFIRSRYVVGIICIAVGVGAAWLNLNSLDNQSALADDPVPNTPIGDAKGIYPGRVVWIHDPNATHWDGPGDGYSWQPEHTTQKYVDAMVSRSIRELSGEDYDSDAWNQLFMYFNDNHGKGQIGYTQPEKIVIKVNLTTCNLRLGSVNPETYDKISYLDKSDTSPQVIIAILRQLVYEAGVNPADIAVGDTLTYFPNQWWDLCHSEFPEVVYFDQVGQQGRVKSESSTIQQHWSHGLDPISYEPDYIPLFYAEADYLINIAVLKGHGAGITLCAKNHYGSYDRMPDADGYYDLHDSLAGTNPDDGQYRALVDIMGHPHMGGKTLLYMLDGLYGGYYWDGTAYKFQTEPFNNDWPSSIFVSQDPVAIDSVGLDILWEEWPHVVRIGGVADYLHEAAMAENPPSGTLYDPNGDGIGIGSLGVHEHWNNPIDKQYSGNLGIGNGIELRYVKLKHYPGDLNFDNLVGIMDLMKITNDWLWVGEPGSILEDIVEDGVVNLKDFMVISENWKNSF